ncbi:MAG: copper-containing nitrite reductase [Patescibacteria group bacterium]
MHASIILESSAWILAATGIVLVVWYLVKSLRADWPKTRVLAAAFALLAAASGAWWLANASWPVHFALPPMMQAMAPHPTTPAIPIPTALRYLLKPARFERVAVIGRDPNDVPPPIERTQPDEVAIEVTAREVIGETAEGVYFNYWTYDGTVPGPMYRVRVGDSVTVTLRNDPSSLHAHNIDLHAVTGPGGGAAVTNVNPGESKSFRWKALQPGLYVYHCAQPNVSTHNAHGQYGLILVEPEGGLPKVDKEFYVMQGELYTKGGLGRKGLNVFDPDRMLAGDPTYVTFNGMVERAPRMKANVGERVRMYVGNGGVGLVSSFHVIGEIFDAVYPEAAIGSEPHKNIQTTLVPAGGASIVEFTLDVPGKYTLVDHALARMNEGAWAVLDVAGDPNPDVFKALSEDDTMNK